MKLLRKRLIASFTVIGLAGALQASTHELVLNNARNDLALTQTNLLRDLSPKSLLQSLALTAEQLLSGKPAKTQDEWVTSYGELLRAESLVAHMKQKLANIAGQLTKVAEVERQLADPVVSARQIELGEIFELWQDSLRLLTKAAKKRRDAAEQSTFFRAEDLLLQGMLRATVSQREKAADLGLASTTEQLTGKINSICGRLNARLPGCGESSFEVNSMLPALKAIRDHLAQRCKEHARHPDCQRIDQILALDPTALTELNAAEKLELESWVIDQTMVMEGGL